MGMTVKKVVSRYTRQAAGFGHRRCRGHIARRACVFRRVCRSVLVANVPVRPTAALQFRFPKPPFIEVQPRGLPSEFAPWALFISRVRICASPDQGNETDRAQADRCSVGEFSEACNVNLCEYTRSQSMRAPS